MKRYFLPVALVIAVAVFVGSGFWWGYSAGQKNPEHITVSGVTNIDGNGTTAADFGIFWKTWQYINDHHLKGQEVNNQDRVYGAVRGLVRALNDPYSEFFPPKEGKAFQETVEGSFGGVGIEIGMRKGSLVIIAPLKGSPGEQAGLKAGDFILQINSSSTAELTIDEAVQQIRGPQGSKVTLTVMRESWDEPEEFEITRSRIDIPTLDFTMKEGNVGYVQLYGFNANAPQLFQEAASRALREGAKGMILDLRNNPGGYLEVAVRLAGWFLPTDSLVVSEAGRNGTTGELHTEGPATLKDMPIVVLMNQGSASASEILAGALRDHRKIQLVGEQSFGKGTVQELETFPDGSILKLTIAHWVLPSGHVLESEGLKPDVEVVLTDEDFENERDPQFDKALEIIKQEIK